MTYVGGKVKLAKYIVPIIQSFLKGDCVYVEPFVGGGSIVSQVKWPVRIASDIHEGLIVLYRQIQHGWVPPNEISEEEYSRLRRSHSDLALRTFAGFASSFGAKFFGGYARSKQRNYAAEGARNLAKMRPGLLGVDFRHTSYSELCFGWPAVIYCDPPYADTLSYSTGKFDSAAFWRWAQLQANNGHTVLVSEFSCPLSTASVLWETARKYRYGVNENSQERVDRLYLVHRDV